MTETNPRAMRASSWRIIPGRQSIVFLLSVIFIAAPINHKAECRTINERLPYFHQIAKLSSQPLFTLKPADHTTRGWDRNLRTAGEPIEPYKAHLDRTLVVSYRLLEEEEQQRPNDLSSSSEKEEDKIMPTNIDILLEPFRRLRRLQQQHNITYQAFDRQTFGDADDQFSPELEQESEYYAAHIVARNMVMSRLQAVLRNDGLQNNDNELHGLELEDSDNVQHFSTTYLTGLHMEVLQAPHNLHPQKLRAILKSDPLVKDVWFDEIFEGQQQGQSGQSQEPLDPPPDDQNEDFEEVEGSSAYLTWDTSPQAIPRDMQQRQPPLQQPLYDSSAISSVHQEGVANSVFNPNDCHYPKQWAHTDVKYGVKTPLAWNLWTGGRSNFVVALIDSGVDYKHKDLMGQFWQNPGETNCYDGIDDDENGYVDDCMGWDWIENDNLPQDQNGHGTSSAGIIAGVANNSIGITGVCWGCKLMVLRTLDKDIKGTISGFIKALDYAISHGAKVSNNSYGGRGSVYAGLEDAVKRADAKNMLMIAAAGNYGSNNDNSKQPTYPASYPYKNIISVAASDTNGMLASFSCYGPKTVDVAAPGVNIWTTALRGTYSPMDGTSFSAPFVTGAAALLWSQYPLLSSEQVKALILMSADDSLRKWTGYGLLNIGRAAYIAKHQAGRYRAPARHIGPNNGNGHHYHGHAGSTGNASSAGVGQNGVKGAVAASENDYRASLRLVEENQQRLQHYFDSKRSSSEIDTSHTERERDSWRNNDDDDNNSLA